MELDGALAIDYGFDHMAKPLLLIFISTICGSVGQIFFKRGVKPLSAKNLFLWLGIAATTLYFFLWMAVLSLADVSWALPLRSGQYLLVALMALLFLKEKISKKRWIGIALVTIGIFFIAQSWGG